MASLIALREKRDRMAIHKGAHAHTVAASAAAVAVLTVEALRQHNCISERLTAMATSCQSGELSPKGNHPTTTTTTAAAAPAIAMSLPGNSLSGVFHSRRLQSWLDGIEASDDPCAAEPSSETQQHPAAHRPSTTTASKDKSDSITQRENETTTFAAALIAVSAAAVSFACVHIPAASTDCLTSIIGTIAGVSVLRTRMELNQLLAGEGAAATDGPSFSEQQQLNVPSPHREAALQRWISERAKRPKEPPSRGVSPTRGAPLTPRLVELNSGSCISSDVALLVTTTASGAAAQQQSLASAFEDIQQRCSELLSDKNLSTISNMQISLNDESGGDGSGAVTPERRNQSRKFSATLDGGAEEIPNSVVLKRCRSASIPIPAEFIDPCTGALMDDPVTLKSADLVVDRSSYERVVNSPIYDLLTWSPRLDFATIKQIKNDTPIANAVVRSEIKRWRTTVIMKIELISLSPPMSPREVLHKWEFIITPQLRRRATLAEKKLVEVILYWGILVRLLPRAEVLLVDVERCSAQSKKAQRRSLASPRRPDAEAALAPEVESATQDLRQRLSAFISSIVSLRSDCETQLKSCCATIVEFNRIAIAHADEVRKRQTVEDYRSKYRPDTPETQKKVSYESNDGSFVSSAKEVKFDEPIEALDLLLADGEGSSSEGSTLLSQKTVAGTRVATLHPLLPAAREIIVAAVKENSKSNSTNNNEAEIYEKGKESVKESPARSPVKPTPPSSRSGKAPSRSPAARSPCTRPTRPQILVRPFVNLSARYLAHRAQISSAPHRIVRCSEVLVQSAVQAFQRTIGGGPRWHRGLAQPWWHFRADVPPALHDGRSPPFSAV